MLDVDVDVKDLIEEQKRIESDLRKLRGPEMLQAMRNAVLIVLRDVKINSPVDTGRLRSSITPEVFADGDDVVGVVGSNVEYAKWQEFGTRPHWPPPGALQPWARRHGMDEHTIRWIIGTRGTKAKKFFTRAIEDNRNRVIRELEKGIKKIIDG